MANRNELPRWFRVMNTVIVITTVLGAIAIFGLVYAMGMIH